ncbi:MAG: hypothetical protein ACF8Q5_07000 [Phycisphaerales bacterium JB040]
MSPRVRLVWWIVCAAGTVAAMALRLVEGDPELAAWVGAGVVQGVCLGGMVWLLATTPRDAIRLSPSTSWTVVCAGVWLQLVLAVDTADGLHVVASGVLGGLVPLLVWSTVLGVGASAWWASGVGWGAWMPLLLAWEGTALGSEGWQVGVVRGVGIVGLLLSLACVGVLSGGFFEQGEDGRAPGGSAGLRWGIGVGIANIVAGLVVLLS